MRMTKQAYLDIVGIPPPPKPSVEIFLDLITKTVKGLHKHRDGPDYIEDGTALIMLFLSLSFYSIDEWNDKFLLLRTTATDDHLDPNDLWAFIAKGFSNPKIKIACLKVFPNIDRERYFQPTQHPTPGLEHISNILPRAYMTPQAYWKEENSIRPRIIPRIKLSRPTLEQETIIQFITNRAPSINYLQVFILISRHTKNRFSRRGRKVYPYGQDYAAQKLDISTRTVRRVFSWLKRKGIIFKRTKENPDLDKCATWFVCTSWKQSAYFRDPEGRRPKKGSPRSRKK